MDSRRDRLLKPRCDRGELGRRPMLGLFYCVRGWIAAESQPLSPLQQPSGASHGSRHELSKNSRLHPHHFFGSCNTTVNIHQPSSVLGLHISARADQRRPMEHVADQGIDRAQPIFYVPTHAHPCNLTRARTLNSRNAAGISNMTSDARVTRAGAAGASRRSIELIRRSLSTLRSPTPSQASPRPPPRSPIRTLVMIRMSTTTPLCSRKRRARCRPFRRGCARLPHSPGTPLASLFSLVPHPS